MNRRGLRGWRLWPAHVGNDGLTDWERRNLADEYRRKTDAHPTRGETMTGQTYWNGLPTRATRGTAVVADNPAVPLYWARDLVGRRIPVVRVTLDGVSHGGGVAYLDNQDGSGWRKVTSGHGGPRLPHRDVTVEDGSFRHDPRCISLTESDFNDQCDCRTLLMIDAFQPVDQA